MEEMKRSHPDIEITIPGVEYQEFAGYRLLMCTDPVKMAILDPECDLAQSVDSYVGSDYVYLYNKLIDAGKWLSHLTAVVLIMQHRKEEILAAMIARDGLNTPNLTSAQYEQLFFDRNQEKVELPWLFESYREQAAEETRSEMVAHGKPYREIELDKMFFKK